MNKALFSRLARKSLPALFFCFQLAILSRATAASAAGATPEPTKVPFIYRIQVDDSFLDIPLVEVDFSSSQDYIVDGKIHVIELTISLRNKGLIRIYYIEQLKLEGKVPEKIDPQADRAETLTEKFLRPPSLSPTLQSRSNEKVVKNYPATTHLQVVEYRINDLQWLEQLKWSFESTFLNYRTAELESLYAAKNKVDPSFQVEPTRYLIVPETRSFLIRHTVKSPKLYFGDTLEDLPKEPIVKPFLPEK